MKRKWVVGDTASVSGVFDTESVAEFAALSGDTNPLHLDEEYAKTTRFNGRIVHGFLYGSLLSKVIATKLPGQGSVYLEQEMKFLNPVRHGEEVTAFVIIDRIDDVRNIFYLQTDCYVADRKVIEGFAKVMYCE